ncbi:MAG: hypothetical protein GY930_02710 [bacterium]|nr:hypothetical protein [bacterium]
MATAPGDFGVAVGRPQGGGSVDIYVLDPTTGQHNFSETLVSPTGGVGSEWYGRGLDYEAGWLAVGSQAEGTQVFGAVHLYQWNGSTFDHATSLVPSTPVPHGEFGRDLSFSGNRLAVSSKGNDGAIFIYKRIATGQWIESHIVRSSSSSPWSQLTHKVELEGDFMAVSTTSYNSDPGGTIFHYNSLLDDWLQEGTFRREEDSDFSLDNQVLVTGNTSLGVHSLITYRRSSLGVWQNDPAEVLTLPIPAERIAVEGSGVAIGIHPYVSSSPITEPLSIELYNRQANGSWSSVGQVTEGQRYMAALPNGQVLFGTSLELMNGRLYAGAPRDGPDRKGRVYVQDLACSLIDDWTCFQQDPNSTGSIGTMHATGSVDPADQDLTLTAYQLPTNQFGYFVTSQVASMTPIPVGSHGSLCLSGPLGRFNAIHQIRYSGSSGSVTFQPDLLGFPTPTGPVAVQAGQTWHFQFWHRDSGASNFTDGVNVGF